MKKQHFAPLFVSIAAVIVAASASPSHAQLYAWVNGGASMLQDAETTDTVSGLGTATGDISFDTGWVGTAALGYRWQGFRFEGEVAYRTNDLDKVEAKSVTVAGFGVVPVTGTADLKGDISSWGGMVNVWYDINLFGGPLVPFVGGGVGAQTIRLDVESVGGTATSYKESDTVFAYQVGTGLGFKVTPNILLTASYRYLGSTDPKFDNGTDKVEGSYNSHNLLAGLLVGF